MSFVKHGYCVTHKRLYHIFKLMHRRCEKAYDKGYIWYGARGIKVCPEWADVKGFIEWSEANGYADGLTIDRIDVNGDYEPKNCRWVTIKQQERNRRDSDMIGHGGETMCLAAWAERIGISQAALWNRIYVLKWPIDKALSTPLKRVAA